MVLGELDEGLLGEVRMMFNLDDSWLNPLIAEEVAEQRTIEVAAIRFVSKRSDVGVCCESSPDTDVRCKTQIDELLHGLPGLLNGGILYA